jgi:hypothetical protein
MITMATYKVTSDRLANKKRGDLLSSDDAGDLNIDALIAAGHLELARVTKSDKTASESEK